MLFLRRLVLRLEPVSHRLRALKARDLPQFQLPRETHFVTLAVLHHQIAFVAAPVHHTSRKRSSSSVSISASTSYHVPPLAMVGFCLDRIRWVFGWDGR
ncbi:hypothetical protein EV2_004909 [Malus domestica]